MKYFTSVLVALALVAAFALVGCGSKKVTSEEATQKLGEKFTPRVGQAKKNELVEYFGRPDWCRVNDDNGVETCRFLKKTGTAYTGEKRDKKNHMQYEEVLAEFDTGGILRKLDVNAQK